MNKTLQVRFRLAFLLTVLLAASPVSAEKPSWAGGGHDRHGEGRQERHEGRSEEGDRGGHENRDRDRAGYGAEPYFNDRHRSNVRDYYAEQFRAGRCPPGLEKKHNGCLPPGQARQWAVGQALPRNVVYYDVPVDIVGAPPPGYRFVRVASDILMIAVGSGMVVEALTDLGGW